MIGRELEQTLTTSPPSVRSWRDWGLAVLLITSIVLGIAMGEMMFAPQRLGAAGATVLVLLAAAVFVRVLGARMGLLGLLIATCLIDRFTYPVKGVDIRGEQVAALLGLGLVAYLVVTRPGGWNLARPNLTEALLGLWLAINLVSSLTAAPDVSRSVKGVGLLLISCAAVLLPRRLLDKTRAAEQMDVTVKLLLIALAAAGAYGTGVFLAHVFGSSISISANGATGHLSAYGTLWEPNVLGAMSAAGAVAWAWLGPRYFRFAWLGTAACLGGTIVSFTRAAWVAAALLLAFSLFKLVRRRADLKQLGLGLAGAAVIALAVVGAETVTDYFAPVAPGAGGAPAPVVSHGLLALLVNSVDVIGRLDQVKTVLSALGHHPLLGSGTASYGETHVFQGLPEHIANLELTVLNDTGVIGALVFLAFVLALAYAAWRHRSDPIVAGLGLATLVILITNSATETTELMISWLMLGLLLMAIDVARSTTAIGSSESVRPTA
jgi:O-antigen ligase